MLMGTKLMPLPEDPHVRFAGVLPDAERFHALEAATVVVVPSPHESLSLLALEAMAVGTPVLVNAQSEVLVDHCRKSNAGLYYADRWEFTEALKLLMKDAALRAAMGRNGKAYVAQNYRWSTILRKYERLFAAAARGSGSRMHETRESAAGDQRSARAPAAARAQDADRQIATDQRPDGRRRSDRAQDNRRPRQRHLHGRASSPRVDRA